MATEQFISPSSTHAGSHFIKFFISLFADSLIGETS